MDQTTLIIVLFGAFTGLLLIGLPVAISLGVAALGALLYLEDNPIKMVQIAFRSVSNFPLMALPAFILAGALMEAAGISRRLISVAEAIAGRFTGGLSATAVLACLFFGAISGSGPATTAAVGMLMIPAMIRRGYERRYASAITASAGGLGIIIPPSIPMVIFGIAAIGLTPPADAIARFGPFPSVSIAGLFLAGVIPGLILAGALLTLNYLRCRKAGYRGNSTDAPAGDLANALRQGIWSILAPLVILGGIYSGLFTPTESAIVAIVYTLVVGAFIHRELNWRAVSQALDTTGWLSGRILLILFTATLFGRVLVEQHIPATLADAMFSLTENRYLIWLILIAFLLCVGMFMETLAAIMILTPILLPIAYSLGIDPTHFGIVMICCLSIGFATPPLGENLFVASAISGERLENVTLSALPFVLAAILAVVLIAFVPQLSLFLPGLPS